MLNVTYSVNTIEANMKDIDKELMDAYAYDKSKIPTLLAQGADPRVEEDVLYYYAGQQGEFDVLEELLDRNVEPMFVDHNMVARVAIHGQSNCLALLLLNGLDIGEYAHTTIYDMLSRIRSYLFDDVDPSKTEAIGTTAPEESI